VTPNNPSSPAQVEWSAQTGLVALYSARIRFYASNLVEAIELGSPAGFDDEPWGPRYQRQAAKIYVEVLPEDYLIRLGSVFLGCVQAMDTQPDPDSTKDWRIVRFYFAHAAEAIQDVLQVELAARSEDPTDQEPVTPGVVRFDLLAGSVSIEGAERLRTAGDRIAEHFGCMSQSLALDDRQLSMLRSLADGMSLTDVAEAHFVSRRTCHRHVDEIAEQLGVANWPQAITLAAQQGWL